MNADTIPKPISTDAHTVTIRRTDWDAHVAAIENAGDLQSLQEYRAWAVALGPEEAKRLSYTAAEAASMLDGQSALATWRNRAGLTQRALATAAAISPSYLAEIEAGKKPGSAAAIRAVARVLNVPMEMLV